MNPDKEDPAPEPEPRKGFLARLAALVPFGKPETKEELELEIQELLEEGEDKGLIGAIEEKMINSVLDFRNTLADEIMTPAVDMFSVPANLPLDELIERVIDSGFTRTPVYRDDFDQIIGLIHAKDLLKICARRRDQPFHLEEHLLPVHMVGENKPIVDLLREFQQKKAHMAVVTDEFGAVRGLLTMEDIIEEIFGEIGDEYDDEEEPVEHLPDGSLLVPARLGYEVVEEAFSVVLPEGPYESVGGLVIHLLGRLGRIGDKARAGDLLFEVKNASRRRIKTVRVVRVPDEEEQA
ncbi:MAG: hemolysin family protein [Desulfobulbaceae bacterium]|jgi:CBS domain containing-hemolysin-like protein|nr:hemolysin family protein [Desulfobulbaceae bacterium]